MEALVRSLNYVIAQNRGSRLEKIVLSGTASHLKKLECYLSDKLGIPVERMQNRLLSEISEQIPESRGQSGRWATALGLALFGEGLESMGSNPSVEKEIAVGAEIGQSQEVAP